MKLYYLDKKYEFLPLNTKNLSNNKLKIKLKEIYRIIMPIINNFF